MAGDVSSVAMFNCLWWWFGLIVAMIMMTHQLVNFSLMIIILLICIWNFYICPIAVPVPAFITFNDAFGTKPFKSKSRKGLKREIWYHQLDHSHHQHLSARKTTSRNRCRRTDMDRHGSWFLFKNWFALLWNDNGPEEVLQKEVSGAWSWYEWFN